MPNRSLLAAALAFLSACAAGPRAASSRFAPVAAPESRSLGSRPAAAPLRMRDVVASAWRAADSVAAAGDANAIAGMFAPDAQLVRAAGDTLRGREAIAAWLSASLPPAAQLRFRFNRVEQLVECADWAVEEGVLSAWRRGPGLEDSLVTSIGLRWERASDSTAQVAFATLDGASARSLRRSARCRVSTAAIQSQGRQWVLSLAPDAAEHVRVSDAYPAMIERRGQGWNSPDSPTCVLCPQASRKVGKVLPGLSYLGARYRGFGPLAIEAFVLDQSAEEYEYASYEATRAVEIFYRKTGYVTGALVSYERSWVRLGAGPAYTASEWKLEERRTSFPEVRRTDEISAFGGVAQLAVMVPVLERFAIEGRAQWFGFSEATMRGTPEFGAVDYDQAGLALTFGLGVLV